MDSPGKRILYMPQNFTKVPPIDWPIHGQNMFPFPHPHVQQYSQMQTHPFGFKGLSGVPLRTRDDSHTKAAEIVNSLPHEDRLHHVKVNSKRWPNLINYAEGSFHNAPPVATAGQQVDGINALWGWSINHLNTVPGQVNSEPAVQDQIKKQVVDVLDLLLKTRYINTYHTIPPTGGAEFPVDNGPAGQRNGFLPGWGRAVFPSCTVQTQRTAEYPDYLLYRSVQYLDQCAILEIKNWWAYTDATIAKMFTRGVLTDGGAVHWTRTSLSHHLLKQIYGELFFFRCDWGILTNGATLVVFVLTKNEKKRSRTYLLGGDQHP